MPRHVGAAWVCLAVCLAGCATTSEAPKDGQDARAPLALRGSVPVEETPAPAPEDSQDLLLTEPARPGPSTSTDAPESIPWLDSRTATWGYFRREGHLIGEDYQHFYSWNNLAITGLEIALVAPLANTSADQHIHEWYQREVRSRSTNHIAKVAKQFGEVIFTVPAYLGATGAGWMAEEGSTSATLGEWGNRSLRALLAGAPALGILQIGLGSGRPDTDTSSWQPFHSSHGASGHAFVGSVPFLTAASMTDNRWLQVPLVGASFLTAWSRINDGAHFTSQTALGWCLGCTAVLSVNATEREEQAIRFLPVSPEGEPGASLEIRY